MFDKNKFRAKVIENGLTMTQVANQLNINVATLYRKVNGTSDFTRTEIQTLKDLLKLTVREATEIFFAS